jgi:hypothetical protein
MRKIWIALLVMMPCLFAHGDGKNCKEVGPLFRPSPETLAGPRTSCRHHITLPFPKYQNSGQSHGASYARPQHGHHLIQGQIHLFGS